MKRLLLLIFLSAQILVITSCSFNRRIFTDYDLVYFTKRFELKEQHRLTSYRSPVKIINQTIIKEIDANNTQTYNVFDVLYSSVSSFQIENRVFLIADNEAFKVDVNFKDFEKESVISTDTEEVSTSDSTSVTVVKDYSLKNHRITRLNYSLTPEMINKIKESNKVYFRYYAGPDMVTTSLSSRQLKRMKKLIHLY